MEQHVPQPLGAVAIEKGAFELLSTAVANFTLYSRSDIRHGKQIDSFNIFIIIFDSKNFLREWFGTKFSEIF